MTEEISHPNAARQAGGHISYIDGLRAIAVIAVIANHFNNAVFTGGYLGVDVFFVISGYVITRSIRSRTHSGLKEFLLDFYLRRIKRLMPALAVCVVLTSLLISLVDPNPGVSLGTGIAALFGVSNIFLLYQAADYFSNPAALNAFTQTWSLGAEEQFYLVYPLLIGIFGIGVAGNTRRVLFAVLLAILSVASLAAFIHLSQTNAPAAFYLMPTRFWELACGAMACLIQGRYAKPVGVARYAATPACLVLAAILIFAPIDLQMIATIATAVTTAIILVSGRGDHVGTTWLAKRPVVYIGKISYSLYLYHWTVLVLSRWTIGLHWWTLPFQLTAMFVLARESYNRIEEPYRYKPWSDKRWKAIAKGAGVMTGSALLVLTLILLPGRGLYAGAAPPLPAVGLADPYTSRSGALK